MRNNSEIILCKGIKLDKNYENVLSYNESSMVSLCRSNAIYTGTNYKIVGVKNNIINVSASYASCIYANYMAFKNPLYGNKWFFAWITDVTLLNPNTTQITFKVDVFSTWYSSFNVGQAFIEREHVSDDTLGANLVPENLETGEYIAQNLSGATDFNTYALVVASMLNLDSYITSSYVTKEYHVGMYNGIPAGCGYYKFTDLSVVATLLGHLATDGLTDNIICMFIAPSSLVTIATGKTYAVESSNTVNSVSTGISRATAIGTYTPVNKKVLTYPYVWINLTNGVGQSAILQQEFWELNSDNEMAVDIISVLCPGMSIKAIPKNYKGKGTAFDDGITFGKFPQVSYPNDLYTNWLTQNGVNLGFTTLNANEWANVKGGLQMIGGIAQTAWGGDVAGGASNVIGGYQNIFNEMQEEYRRSFTPLQLQGSLNSGDVATAGGFNRLFFSRMTITEDFARRIDKYFSRFGYRVNDVKTPNLNSRTKFNYIKVGGMDELIHGDIPANDLEEINSIFRKGVTIFHNYNDIGNYTISNPIVTP